MKAESFLQAIRCLPPQTAAILRSLSNRERAGCEEIRLRAGQPLSIECGGGERPLGSHRITTDELGEVIARATDYSVHTFTDSLKQGFLTIAGGHRLGVCGTAVMQQGEISTFRHVSSVNLRIARQIKGAAGERLYEAVHVGGGIRSTLILSPPGRGKTTLLRDLTRQLSDSGLRMGVADERCELSGMYRGMPQFDLGTHTDIIDSCPKAQAAMMLVKTMSPKAVVLDEITTEQDARAIQYACHCGAAVLATAHALDFEDFSARPLYRSVLDMKVFECIAVIGHERQVRLIQ
ncbi:MAG: stage III sporulation protein AB [Butyricicoccaceae bacterium]